MRVRVRIEDRVRDVEVLRDASGRTAVSVDGKPVAAEIREVPGGLLVALDGRLWDVVVGTDGSERMVASGPWRTLVTVVDEHARRVAEPPRSRGARVEAVGALKSPMPCRVVRVLVAAGDAVRAGQPLVVVEAMKMESELRAPADARVEAVLVEPGASVERDAPLVTFSSAEPGSTAR
ncbi:MAG: hypothetical protein NZ898_16345 [Myxococcota bacterium]|nr:hypothetical protein [Myxococcota bacterium]MDW8361476.1 biotin/lipoyl-containing protein [Myxococcales bacterium]